MKSLVPCPACRRHVRASERACPFCHADLPETLASAVVPGATQRMKRAAAFAFTASLAIAGCSDTAGPSPTPDASADASADAPGDEGGVMPLYGLPADVPTTPDGMSPDAGPPADDGGPVAMYGGPPDASPADTGPADDGSVMALYGAVPDDVSQTDAADVTDTGGGGVRYGAPPAEGWA